MSIPYIIQGDNIVLVIDNTSHNINKAHISYSKIYEAIKVQDWESVKTLVETRKAIASFADGNVEIKDDQLLWKGTVLNSVLSRKILDMFREGFTIDPMVNFMSNLMQNPSKQAVNELYLFLEKGNLPITSDGHFLAYKKVRNDYKDIYSGKFDNSVGAKPSMERNEVDDNRDVTCSSGLHFCSESYLGYYGTTGNARIMIVKVNPRDVVSIPKDYANAKARACTYEVVGELGVAQQPSEAFTSAVQDVNTAPTHNTEVNNQVF